MLNFFISTFDQFSYKPHLYVKGNERYISFIPAAMGFVTYLASFLIASFFLIDALNRHIPLISMNGNPNIYPVINISNTPIQIFFTQGQYQTVDPSICNFTAYYVKYLTESSSNSSTIKLDLKQIYFEQCRASDLEKYGVKSNPNTICLNPGTHNLTIAGAYGDGYRGFSYLNIFVNQCRNSTESNIVCKPKQVIDEYLKSIQVSLAMQINYINHENSNNPFVQDFKMMILPMSNTIFKRYFVNLKNVIYTTDLGMIFENKISQYDYIYGSQEVNVDLKLGALFDPTAFGQISLTADPVSSEYKRSYTKLQTVIANSGGALKFLQTITLIICQITTKRLYFQELINLNFTNKSITVGKHNESKTPIFTINNYMNKSKQFEDLFANDEKNIKMKLKEKICPQFLWNKKKKLFYNKAEKRIMNELTYRNLIKIFLEFEKLKIGFLSEKQLHIFENLPRIYPEEKKDCIKKINFDLCDFDDSLIKKIISSFY